MIGSAAAWVVSDQSIPVIRSDFADLAHEPACLGGNAGRKTSVAFLAASFSTYDGLIGSIPTPP